MVTESEERKAWAVAEQGRAVSLTVVLRQRTFVFPWSMFLGAEGTDGEVKATFHTHMVRVEGSGLTGLLQDLAAQLVRELQEPDRTARFSRAQGPLITSISVVKNAAGQGA
jgi:hypothetical protein